MLPAVNVCVRSDRYDWNHCAAVASIENRLRRTVWRQSNGLFAILFSAVLVLSCRQTESHRDRITNAAKHFYLLCSSLAIAANVRGYEVFLRTKINNYCDTGTSDLSVC